MMTRDEAERRAVERALARGGAAAVTRVRYGLYRVASSSRAGRFHTVSVDGAGVYRCDCEAGIAGKVCWAMGAVYVAKVEAKGARVTGPSREAAPLPAAPGNVIQLKQRRGGGAMNAHEERAWLVENIEAHELQIRLVEAQLARLRRMRPGARGVAGGIAQDERVLASHQESLARQRARLAELDAGAPPAQRVA